MNGFIKLTSSMALAGLCSCASLMPSSDKLEAAPSCKVWKDGVMGFKSIANVTNETAEFEHSCNMWGCSKVFANYKNTEEIYTSNSGLLTLETKLGSYDGSKFKVDSKIVGVEPFELLPGKANYMTTVLGKTHDVTVHFNKVCTKRQAALGIAVVFSQ